MNVIGYARLSAAREESTSIERQREIIEKTADARGWNLVDIIVDPVASASRLRLDRPGLTKARKAVASGRAEAIVVWRLDRISRSVVDFGILIDEGTQIVSATETFDTTDPAGRAMAEILQIFSGMETRATSARVKSSIAYLRRNGRFPGGLRPYGYRSAPAPTGAGKVLEIDPAQAVVIREAADRVLAGETVYAVARDFTARSVPTPRHAKGWTHTALRGILVGDAVLGRVKSHKELLRDEHGLPRVVWPAILTVEESSRLRAMLAVTPAGPRRKASRLLSGIAVCGSCGHALVAQRAKDRPTVYRCKAHTRGLSCDSPTSINAEKTDAEITSRFLASFGNLQVIEEVVTAPEPAGLAEVEEAIQDTASALTAPGADVPALVERLTSLRARREEIQALPAEPVHTMVETGLTFAETWETSDGTGRRRLLLSAIDHVTVKPTKARQWDASRLEIVWNS